MKIVFTSATGFVAWAIRKITGSKASHVAIQLDDGTFLQADQGGVAISDKKTFLLNGERKIIAAFEPSLNVVQYLNIEWGKSKVGAGYDYLGIVGNIIPTLSWRWFHLKLGDPFNMASKYWCSELIAALDTKKKISEFQKFDPKTVTPGQLLKALSMGTSFTSVDIKLV